MADCRLIALSTRASYFSPKLFQRSGHDLNLGFVLRIDRSRDTARERNIAPFVLIDRLPSAPPTRLPTLFSVPDATTKISVRSIPISLDQSFHNHVRLLPAINCACQRRIHRDSFIKARNQRNRLLGSLPVQPCQLMVDLPHPPGIGRPLAGIDIIVIGLHVSGRATMGPFVALAIVRIEAIFISGHFIVPSVTEEPEAMPGHIYRTSTA